MFFFPCFLVLFFLFCLQGIVRLTCIGNRSTSNEIEPGFGNYYVGGKSIAAFVTPEVFPPSAIFTGSFSRKNSKGKKPLIGFEHAAWDVQDGDAGMHSVGNFPSASFGKAYMMHLSGHYFKQHSKKVTMSRLTTHD